MLVWRFTKRLKLTFDSGFIVEARGRRDQGGCRGHGRGQRQRSVGL
jgi:hypothetical protein